MSVWTQANFTIRINGSRNIDEIQRLIGYSCDWSSLSTLMPSKNPEKFLPMGSEGTLMIKISKTKKKFTEISVYGGLRDRCSTKDIEMWIDNIKTNAVRGYHGEFVVVTSIRGWAGTDGAKDYELSWKRKNIDYEELYQICRRNDRANIRVANSEGKQD